jgi:hypothetical protein
MVLRHALSPIGLLLCVGLLSGCKREDSQVYYAPKEKPPTETAALPAPAWTVPSGWQEMPASEFLLAKFLIQGGGDARAEVNVTMLAGEGGGVLANVNRWRGQLGLDPLKDEMELAHLNPTVDLPGGGRMTLVDFTGTDSKTGKPARLVGVILPLAGQTLFYKLMGDEQIVGQQKEAFTKFIQSAKYPNVR